MNKNALIVPPICPTLSGEVWVRPEEFDPWTADIGPSPVVNADPATESPPSESLSADEPD